MGSPAPTQSPSSCSSSTSTAAPRSAATRRSQSTRQPRRRQDRPAHEHGIGDPAVAEPLDDGPGLGEVFVGVTPDLALARRHLGPFAGCPGGRAKAAAGGQVNRGGKKRVAGGARGGLGWPVYTSEDRLGAPTSRPATPPMSRHPGRRADANGSLPSATSLTAMAILAAIVLPRWRRRADADAGVATVPGAAALCRAGADLPACRALSALRRRRRAIDVPRLGATAGARLRRNHRIVYGTGRVVATTALADASGELLERPEIAYLHARSASTDLRRCTCGWLTENRRSRIYRVPSTTVHGTCARRCWRSLAAVG